MAVKLLSVQNVSKQFGGVIAVNDLSFDIYQDEVLGVMGPNGAGKSTLTNLISGDYFPTSGKIFFKDTSIGGLPSHKICKQGIGRIYQIPKPFSKLTVLENIAAGAMYGAGMNKADALIEAKKVVDNVGLSELSSRPAGSLEEISLKRLELARALAVGPELLLVDELAGGLTEEELPELLNLISDIRKLGITMMLIEHVMDVLMNAVDRIIVMDSGRKIAEGKPKEIMENEKVIEAYFGADYDEACS